MMDSKIEKLIKEIRRVGAETANSSICYSVKERLLSNIQKDHALIGKTDSLFTQVSMTASQKARVKERVMAFVEGYSKSKFMLSRFFFGHKKMWASMLIFVLFLNVFVFVDGGIPVVSAQYTVLERISGEVSVQRGGQIFPATENFVLSQGDVVRTEASGRAVIRFFDNSVTRLRENTEVVLSRLLKATEHERHNVELGLRAGEVWSFVNEVLSEPSDFVVRSSEVIAEAKPNSTFNVFADAQKGEFKVMVFEEAVDVQVVNNDLSVKESVEKGSSVKVSTVDDKIELQKIDESDNWISENLDQDHEYVEDTIKEEAGLLPENVLHPVKRIKEDAKLLLAFDDIQRAKIKLEIAEKRLLEAEAQGFNEDLGQGRNLLELFQQFKQAYDEFAETILSLKETDPVKYLDLNVYLNAKLNRHKRNLNFVNSLTDESIVDEQQVSEEQKDDSDSKGQGEVNAAPPVLNIFLEEQQDESDLETE